MMVFIDESGDGGFKRSSSLFFVLTLIAVPNEQVELIDKQIEHLKHKNRIFPEYKFSKTSDYHKELFFNTLDSFDFEIYTVVVKKSLVYSSELRNNPKKFYNFFLKQLLQNTPVDATTKIRIDASSSRNFQKEIQLYLRKQLGSTKLNIRFLDSQSENLIQLADMVAGAICRTYAHPEKLQWKHKIKHKIKGIWELPQNVIP